MHLVNNWNQYSLEYLSWAEGSSFSFFFLHKRVKCNFGTPVSLRDRRRQWLQHIGAKVFLKSNQIDTSKLHTSVLSYNSLPEIWFDKNFDYFNQSQISRQFEITELFCNWLKEYIVECLNFRHIQTVLYKYTFAQFFAYLPIISPDVFWHFQTFTQ